MYLVLLLALKEYTDIPFIYGERNFMEKPNIKFSVLMSIYYKEKPEYLSLALNSVFNQTLKATEVVLVEDGKLTNELESVISNYENKYKELKVIKFEKNRGLGPALNDGIRACKYNYIARVDTDDVCRNDRFEIQIRYLSENPCIDIIGSNMTEYDAEMKNIVSKKVVPENHEEIKKYLKKRNPMNHPTVIYKKDKVLEANSYEDYPYFEDYYLWAKMMKNGCKFYNIQDELYNFRAGSSMIQRRGGKKYLQCILKFEKALLNLKLINKFTYYNNIMKRWIVALLPNSFREKIYHVFLRKKNGDEI